MDDNSGADRRVGMTRDDLYGQAWLDHAAWLLEQGNSRRAGPDRDRLYAESARAREIGLVASGYMLPARLLPFETSFDMGVSAFDTSGLAGSPQNSGWWCCRYCHRGEGRRADVRVTTAAWAERGRLFTHEAMCPARPADQPVTDAERRVMAEYLRAWVAHRLDVVDEQIAMLSPRAGYRQDPDRAAELANWQQLRAEYLAVLTRCGVDDASMALIPAPHQQTGDEFLAEIRAVAARAAP